MARSVHSDVKPAGWDNNSAHSSRATKKKKMRKKSSLSCKPATIAATSPLSELQRHPQHDGTAKTQSAFHALWLRSRENQSHTLAASEEKCFPWGNPLLFGVSGNGKSTLFYLELARGKFTVAHDV